MPVKPPLNPDDLQTVRYEERGDVAHVTLARDRIDMRLVRELTAVCDHLEDHSDARVVVLRGADGVFCRGIDYADFRPDQPVDIHGFNKWEKMCVRLERLRKVTVAVLEGAVVGGGVQLALVTDARIMAPDATLQLDEVHQGFLPGMATWRLPRYVGLGVAKRLVMRCPVVPADEALSLGLVDRVDADLDAATAAVIAEFGPTHVVAVTLARRLLSEASEFSYEEAIGHFLAAQHRAISQTAFLDTIARRGEGEGEGDGS